LVGGEEEDIYKLPPKLIIDISPKMFPKEVGVGWSISQIFFAAG
jgi:hypothetical protein